MENERPYTDNSWHLLVSAALSITLVVALVAWQIRSIRTQKNMDLYIAAEPDIDPLHGVNAAHELAVSLGLPDPTATSSTPEEIAAIGNNTIGQLVAYYDTLSQHGLYTPELGAQIAAGIAPSVAARVPYAMYDAKSLTTDPDTSYVRMRAYRSDLQESLVSLKKNKSYELELYSMYMATHDDTRLAQLKTAAQNYRDAAVYTAKVIVPADAVSSHVEILNAMQQFAATLDFMADNVADPITSLALLKAYTKAETDMFASFDSLDAYYANKRP